MIYDLSSYTIIFNLHKCDWLQIDTEHPQNGSGTLGLIQNNSMFCYFSSYYAVQKKETEERSKVMCI